METKTSTQILATLLFQLFKKEEVEQALRESPDNEKRAYGVEHIFGFEESVGTVLALAPADGLSPLEGLLLRFCAWGRDLGVLKFVNDGYWNLLPESVKKGDLKDEILRKKYDEIAADFIQRKLPDLLEKVAKEIAPGYQNNDDNHVRYRGYITSDQGTPEMQAEKFLKNLYRDSGFYSRMRSDAGMLAATVNLIVQHHRRSGSIDDCPEQRHLAGERIRPRLLAAILRLANALTIGHTRFENPYDIFRVPVRREEDRILWIKSFILSAIRVDPQRETVYIQADLPVGADRPLGVRQDEGLARLREMLDFVVGELEEDVISVSKVLYKEYKEKFPLLLGVKHEVQEIPAMKYTDDIRAALDSIYSAFSPNTSQLITIALRSLKARIDEIKKSQAKKEPKQEVDQQQKSAELAEKLRQEVDQQLKDISEQRKTRPCHEGLRKIYNLLKTVFLLWQSDTGRKALESVQEACGMWFDEGSLRLILTEMVYKVFSEQREAVRANCEELNFDVDIFQDDYKHIIVYGYSQQVIDLLGGVFRKHHFGKKSGNMPYIHVLECRTKTIYSSSGRLLYLDGQRYAKALRAKLKEDPKIMLEPDVALGKILLTFPGKKLILLGSNAVYPDGKFVHSMGHTSVAGAAKALYGDTACEACAVAVVTDSMKIGEVTEVKEEQERNLDAWLTHHRHIVNDLKDRGIELHNWREDRVPPQLIDYLIILDKEVCRKKGPSQTAFPELKGMAFDAPGAFAELFKKKILASTIARAADREEHREEMETMDPRATDDVHNWFAAERFITGKLAKQAQQQPPTKEAEAAKALNDWVGGLWEKNKGVAESLESEILRQAEEVAKAGIEAQAA